MPNEKKSASPAISSAVSAARGTSIMVPMRMPRPPPCSCSITSSVSARSRRSSSAKPISGSMISTPLAPATAIAARTIARTCIS